MNNVFYILLFCCFVTGCASSKLRKKDRADRKIEQAKRLAPELFQVDKVVFIDTVIIETHSIDTVTKIVSHDTTTVVNNDRLVLKYFYDTLRQDIYHEVECKGDTVIKERIKYVDNYKGLSLKDKIQLNIVPLIVLLAFIFMVYLFLRKR